MKRAPYTGPQWELQRVYGSVSRGIRFTLNVIANHRTGEPIEVYTPRGRPSILRCHAKRCQGNLDCGHVRFVRGWLNRKGSGSAEQALYWWEAERDTRLLVAERFAAVSS